MFYKLKIDGAADGSGAPIADSTNNVGLSAASIGTVNPVPEPGTLALLALGIGTLGFAGRRRTR